MSEFNKDKINKLADNLLIGLTAEENNMLLDEFLYVEEHMDLINKIDNLDKVEPLFRPFNINTNIMSEDEAINALDIKEVLKNCKETEGREVKIPKVVGND